MKKLKKTIVSDNQIINKLDTKSSRLTIDSRVANNDKFNQLFILVDSVKQFKNCISTYCFDNIISIIYNYSNFLTQYNLFSNQYLNSWERQTIFQEIAGHYSETTTRYLNKATFKVKQPKTTISKIAQLIYKNSHLNSHYQLEFNLDEKIAYFNQQIIHYQNQINLINDTLLNEDNNDKELSTQITTLENRIKSCEKILANYKSINNLNINKPHIYQRLINLVCDKKKRFIKKIKLGVYKTGTHARHLDNAQFSIIKDTDNKKYQYFLKVRINDKLIGREPKLTAKNKDTYQQLLDNFNQLNFIHLPLIFNKKRLGYIDKTLDNILSKDNPQILIKSEQLRMNQKSQKIHIIFNYETPNKLGELIQDKAFNHNGENFDELAITENNTLGLDINLKHNLLADSNGKMYDEVLNIHKSNFINNVNEIVLLQSIDTEKRTEKEKYRYDKLLRINESLLKTYLSTLIKNWKDNNILHLVLEDLNIINDKSYYEHQDIKIKYTRLSRLLRVGQIKHWVSSMAEKQQMFTHFVNPAYTSQECSHCHYISDTNRKIQETFKCVCCSHEENADINAATNIKYRLLNKNLRNKLCEENVFLCYRPNKTYYKDVKKIIESEYDVENVSHAVVTELLCKTIL